MKLAGAAAARFFARPEADRAGLLIFGADAMRVALKRQEVIAALIGPEGEAEMRLTRLQGAELRKEPSLIADAVKARGFFAGPRVVFVEDAGDAAAPVIGAALKDWRPGDAMMVVTARALGKGSALRKAFENNANAYAAGIYDDPPGRDEIEATLARAGLKDIAPAAMSDLMTLGRALSPGDFRQTAEKIALYKHGDPAPLTPDEVALCAPATIEAEVDDVLHAAAEARAADIGPLMQRIAGQGVNPVTLSIAAMRHFRTLHTVRSAPGGPSEGIARMRPPVFGPRRDRMLRQAQDWPLPRIETALGILTDTDLTLRSASRAPAMAVVERALIRLSMLNRR